MVERIHGYEKRKLFDELLAEVEGGVISPGGASRILGVTRQAVLKLIDGPHVRAWAYYYDFGPQADYVEISVRDLVRYGVRTGRIAKVEDCAFRPHNLAEEIEAAKAELQSATDRDTIQA